MQKFIGCDVISLRIGLDKLSNDNAMLFVGGV